MEVTLPWLTVATQQGLFAYFISAGFNFWTKKWKGNYIKECTIAFTITECFMFTFTVEYSFKIKLLLLLPGVWFFVCLFVWFLKAAMQYFVCQQNFHHYLDVCLDAHMPSIVTTTSGCVCSLAAIGSTATAHCAVFTTWTYCYVKHTLGSAKPSITQISHLKTLIKTDITDFFPSHSK